MRICLNNRTDVNIPGGGVYYDFPVALICNALAYQRQSLPSRQRHCQY